MEYTAFKAGDKVSWDGIKAMVVEDSDADHDEVKVYVQGKRKLGQKYITPIQILKNLNLFRWC